MCLTVPAEIVRAALEMPIGRELWAMIDRHQRKDITVTERVALLEKQWAEEEAKKGRYDYSPDAEAAQREADAARLRNEERVETLRGQYAPRAPWCKP